MSEEAKLKLATQPVCSTPVTKRETNKRARVGSNTCPKCETIIESQNDYLTCSICELGYCMECTNISRPLLNALKDDTSNNFMWTCNGCRQNFPSLTGMKSQLKSIEETTNKRLTTIEDKMCAMGSVIEKKVKDEILTLTPTLVETIKGEIKNSLQDDVRKEIREIEDQKTRAMNLILFNVPESSDESSTVRKEHDNKMLNELCRVIEVRDPEVKTNFRLGNKSNDKVRPLKIVFNNKKQRKDILDNAAKLKDIPTTHHLSRCIIAKDLTVQQRLQNKKRRSDRKKTSV